MTENEYKESWRKRGYSFGIGNVTLERGVDRAVHEDKDELVVVVNGSLEFAIDEEIFVPSCDAEVLIPAKSVHSINNVGTESSVVYYGYKPTSL